MRKQKRCATVGCKNMVADGKHCSTCRSRKSRAADPVNYSYVTLKNNTKRRGTKPFKLTLEQFRIFCYRTDYIRGKGRTQDSHSIDCIENEVGYVEGNIRVLTVGQNAKKGTKILDYDWRSGNATVRINNTPHERSIWFDE